MCAFCPEALGQLITLQDATADFTQSGFAAGQTIDGTTSGLNGWAIDPQEGNSHWLAFETAYDVGKVGGVFIFSLIQNFDSGNGNHRLGKFSFQYTKDARPVSGGFDGTEAWNDFTPASWSSVNGTTFTLSGNALLASGADTVGPPVVQGGPLTDTYYIRVNSDETGITGFRLLALADPSLPSNGPGTRFNGNFVLNEFQVVPEPYEYGLMGVLGLLGYAAYDRRLRLKKA
jgi:hypothetical protein